MPTLRAEVCPACALRLPFGVLSGQLTPLGRNRIPSNPLQSELYRTTRLVGLLTRILLHNCTPMREGDTL